jgi:hypothetical protein
MSTAPFVNPEIFDFAKKRVESLLAAQKEMVQTLEGIHQNVFKHVKAENALAAEFISKIGSVRSVPEATSAYHEWASREMELFAEDGRLMFENGEKLLQASRRMFVNGVSGQAS